MVDTSLNTLLAITLFCNRHAGHVVDNTLVEFRARKRVWGTEYTNTEDS